jgi:hypothetical protein
MTRLQEHYQKTVVPALMEQFKYSSAMQVPRITKITLNMGVGESVVDKKSYGRRRRRSYEDCWPEADCHESAQVRRRIQDTGRVADWLQGDTSARSDV